MIEKTSLADETQVLSIIIDVEVFEDVKEELLKALPKLKEQLIDEDLEELIFMIPSRGSGYSLNHIRQVLNRTGADYKLSILCASKGKFDRPF